MAGGNHGGTAITGVLLKRSSRSPASSTEPDLHREMVAALTSSLLDDAPLKDRAAAAENAGVTTPARPVSRPSPAALVGAAVAWARSPASLPWRGDLVRAALAPAVVGAAALAPMRVVPTTAVLLVAGAYLLLVLTAALGRLESGVRVPAGVLLGLDALHLFWATHLTSTLEGPVPLVAATAGACLLLRLVLLPPVASAPARRTRTVDLLGAGSAPPPATRACPGCPHARASRAHRPQREGLELARAEG